MPGIAVVSAFLWAIASWEAAMPSRVEPDPVPTTELHSVYWPVCGSLSEAEDEAIDLINRRPAPGANETGSSPVTECPRTAMVVTTQDVSVAASFHHSDCRVTLLRIRTGPVSDLWTYQVFC